MRWDRLFADMEAQMMAARLREAELESNELTRAETAEALLQDRFAAQERARVQVGLRGGATARGEVARAGSGWVVLDDVGNQVLVPLESVLWVEGLGRRRQSPESRSRLGLGHVVRALAQARAGVRIHLADGASGAVLEGTVDRAGRDHLDLAMHPDDEFRRRRAVRSVRSIPYWAIGCAVSMPGPASIA